MSIRLLDLEDVIDGDEAKTELADIAAWLHKTNSKSVKVDGGTVAPRRLLYMSARVMPHASGVPMVVHRVQVHTDEVASAKAIDMAFLEDTEVAGRELVRAKEAHAKARAAVKRAQTERSLMVHQKIQGEIDTMAAEAGKDVHD